MKLSDLIRREGDLSSRSGQLSRLYDIADKVEALEALTKRYEDAPVRSVKTRSVCGGHGMSVGVQSVEIGNDMEGKMIADLEGQSVRLVREPARRDG